MDSRIIQQALAKLWMVYPSQSPQHSDAGAAIGALWSEICVDVIDGAFVAAVEEWLRSTERFMPTPGMIRERARTLTGESPTAQAVNEWEHLLAYHKQEAELDFENHRAAIEIINSIGGWGLIEDDMIQLARQKFIEEYVRQARDVDILKLAGSMRLQLGAK